MQSFPYVAGKGPPSVHVREMSMIHTPVMVREVSRYLLHDNSKVVVDATVGCGGHALALLRANSAVRVIGIDRDPMALHEAKRVLEGFRDRIQLVEANFTAVAEVLSTRGKVDGAFADLGVSSLQLDTSSRGFSYSHDGPLDMRMSPAGSTARQLLHDTDEATLAGILRRYGEVSRAGRIARAIRQAVARNAMKTTRDLAMAVDSGLRGKARPAVLSKVFQAVRIAVNDELQNVTMFLECIVQHLNANARIVIITYHSLEDRLVKEFFKRESTGCLCPSTVPVCRCGHKATLEVLTRRVVKPSAEELQQNSRARSARLRAAKTLDKEGTD